MNRPKRAIPAADRITRFNVLPYEYDDYYKTRVNRAWAAKYFPIPLGILLIVIGSLSIIWTSIDISDGASTNPYLYNPNYQRLGQLYSNAVDHLYLQYFPFLENRLHATARNRQTSSRMAGELNLANTGQRYMGWLHNYCHWSHVNNIASRRQLYKRLFVSCPLLGHRHPLHLLITVLNFIGSSLSI